MNRLTDVALAPRTTLGVGGRASYVFEVRHKDDCLEAIRFAQKKNLPIFVLGEGSNTCVSDEGFHGVVLSFLSGDMSILQETADSVILRVDAGISWDSLVQKAVEEGWAGIECLSGIPGKVGAAPIQNIGAYGQEISSVLQTVHVIDLVTMEAKGIPASACRFSYRQSQFKKDWRGQYLITAVVLKLSKGHPAMPAYPELVKALKNQSSHLVEIRREVLKLRRGKSMVYDPKDPNHRSCGSFFLNPILPADQLDHIKERAKRAGIEMGQVPVYPAAAGDAHTAHIKLSAAWLIEKAGFHRGYTHGSAAISSRHCLALINPGAATARDIKSLVSVIRRRILEVYGIPLEPEPVFLDTSGLKSWDS